MKMKSTVCVRTGEHSRPQNATEANGRKHMMSAPLRRSRSGLEPISFAGASKPSFISGYNANKKICEPSQTAARFQRDHGQLTIRGRLDCDEAVKILLHENADRLGARVEDRAEVDDARRQVLVRRVWV